MGIVARKQRAIVCPSCRKGELVRRNRRIDGVPFFGCSRFPGCRFAKGIAFVKSQINKGQIGVVSRKVANEMGIGSFRPDDISFVFEKGNEDDRRVQKALAKRMRRKTKALAKRMRRKTKENKRANKLEKFFGPGPATVSMAEVTTLFGEALIQLASGKEIKEESREEKTMCDEREIDF